MANPFYFEGGLSASNTHELEAILREAEPGQYQDHVQNNNFAAWVRHELDNDLLAQRLEQCRSVQQVVDILHIEHAAQRRKAEKKVEPKQKTTEIHDLRPTRKVRPPQHEEPKPAPTEKSQPEEPEENITPPEMPGKKPEKPEAISQPGFLDRYNAKEFIIGLCIGVVLGVLIYALIIALS